LHCFTASCGEEIDLELTGGVAEIQLRTELFNDTEFYRYFVLKFKVIVIRQIRTAPAHENLFLRDLSIPSKNKKHTQ
jgi:hypothetical protein